MFQQRKQAAGKVLNYKTASEEVKKGIRQGRQNEWTKWKIFNAAVPLKKEESDQLIAEGHVPIHTQWIDTDKNEPFRTPENPDVPPLYTGRLVVCGNEEKGDVRSDSPTIDIEAQNLLLSFASSRRLRIRSADITNAYFEGEEMDRILLLRQPRDGLHDEEIDPDQLLLARVPVYGAHDSGRKFWKKVRKWLIGKGVRENFIFQSLVYIDQ